MMAARKTELASHIVLAGTGGGVGTTTVAALLFAALSSSSRGAPQLLDHSAGDLGLRLPEGDEAPTVDTTYAIHDLGPHASGEAIELLVDSAVHLVVVTAATPAGCAAAERVLAAVRERFGVNGVRRVIVVCVGVFGRHRISADTERLQNAFGRGGVVVLGQDTALAAGGRVPLSRLSAGTARASSQLTKILLERIALRAR